MKVLIAIDQSEASHHAIEWVLSNVWEANCRFKLLTVMKPLHNLRHAGIEILQTDPHSRERLELRSNLFNFLEGNAARLREVFSSYCVESSLVEGDAAKNIVGVAAFWHADLIVMGRRKMGLLSRLAAESVSREVEKTAPCRLRIISAEDVKTLQIRQALAAYERISKRDIREGVSP